MRIGLLQAPSIALNVDICGGIERVELSEMEYLIKKGHEVNLYVSKLVGKKEGIKVIKDISTKKVKHPKLYYFYLLRHFYYYVVFGLKNIQTDILHGHYTPILPLFFPNRSVVHFHGLGIHELIGYRYFRNRYHNGHYIFCSAFVKEEFERNYPDIPKDRLFVVYNGIDINLFKPADKVWSGKIKNIIFYSGWIPVKGIYEVLEMAKILEGRRDDFKIYYGGSAFGHYKNLGWGDAQQIDTKVKSMAKDLNRIEFLGEIKYADLPELLRCMDIGLVPSIYPDPFPLVPLEMMACGLPVVAYNIGGLKESIVDGETGYLVENMRPEFLARAVERLLDNEDLMFAMGRKARERVVQNFTWDKHCEQLEIIYNKVR